MTVVADMAAIHEIAAVADLRDATAGNGAGIHGHGFADGAAGSDLKFGELAAIAQGLRRRAERNERIDRAVIADRGFGGDMDVPDQLAVLADHDMRTDQA